MAFAKLLATAGLLASFAVSAVIGASLPTISTVGSKFYDSNGNQFFIKGLS
jgi:1,3-beta-glucanosyltransferase GAS1